MKIKGINRISLPTFFVLGKEGRGLSEEAASWVAPLWDQMNQDFTEIVSFIDASEMDNLQLWGLMSDQKKWLAPWEETGKYLAGVQVPADTTAPTGWSIWEIPAAEYLTLKTSEDKIEQATEIMLGKVFPLEKVQLAGAVQEHYLPNFSEGEVELFFPIKNS